LERLGEKQYHRGVEDALDRLKRAAEAAHAQKEAQR
jgi:hypothetical protein